MLDADAQAQHLRRDTRRLQLLRRQLAMRGRGRMACQGLGVADIDQTLDHLERVIEFHASVEATLDAEGQQRPWPALEVLLSLRVVAEIGRAARRAGGGRYVEILVVTGN